MLPAFVWTDAVLTGIDTVDAQHKELIDLFKNRAGIPIPFRGLG